MMPPAQLEKYRYYYEKLCVNDFEVQLFGLPRLTPKK